MLSDSSNIFKVFLPIYLVLFILCYKCMLSTRLVSILIFFLLTLPVLILLITILYYSINNVNDNIKNSKDCESDKHKIDILCNKWEPLENKCYVGIKNKDGCNKDIIKNIPKDFYIVSIFIILANIFFASIKMNCS